MTEKNTSNIIVLDDYKKEKIMEITKKVLDSNDINMIFSLAAGVFIGVLVYDFLKKGGDVV